MAFSGFGTTSTAPTFGSSGFGSTQAKPAFGTTSIFGQASTSAPTFGTSTSVPSFGAAGGFGTSSFGAPASNSFGMKILLEFEYIFNSFVSLTISYELCKGFARIINLSKLKLFKKYMLRSQDPFMMRKHGKVQLYNLFRKENH